MKTKPNLLFVFADQMRGMDMHCAGNLEVKTPAMDRLARQGMRLSHCFASIPVCCPNRATLLTGTYALTHRVIGNDLPLPENIPSLGSIAKANGYATGYIGKWHLDGVPRSKFTPRGSRRQGFDYWAVYNCTHAYFKPKYYLDTPDLIEVEGYEPEVQTDLALKFLEEKKNEPFCLALSWGPPHNPYNQVPATYRAQYNPGRLSLRPNAEPESGNPLARNLDARETLADYYAAITALDAQLDRLLQKLDQLQIADDTIVVFTSDHGDMLWSHGWMGKQNPYEESILVPFMARWPGKIPSGTVSDTLFGTVDILPTLLGLMGINPAARMEGQDYSAQLLGEKSQTIPQSVFIANYIAVDEAARQNMADWRGIRTRRYTYVEKIGREPWLLFDNQTDPYQLKNLLGSADPKLLASLQEELAAWLKKTSDPFDSGFDIVRKMGLRDLWNEREKEFEMLWGKTPVLLD